MKISQTSYKTGTYDYGKKFNDICEQLQIHCKEDQFLKNPSYCLLRLVNTSLFVSLC